MKNLLNRPKLRVAFIVWFLPLLLFSIMVVTAWSGLSAWYGGSLSGKGWTSLVTKLAPVVINQISEEAELRSKLLFHRSDEDIVAALARNELALYERGKNKKSLLLSPTASITKQDIAAYSKIKLPGIYFIDGKMVYCSVQRDGLLASKPESLLLIQKMPSITDKLAMITQAEFVLLSDDGTVLDSTFKDPNGDRISPQFDRGLTANLQSTPLAQSHLGKVDFDVPNYRGFRLPDSDIVVYKGISHLRAFSNFFPIVDPSGRVISYIGMLAPEDAVLAGAKKGIWGSSILGLVLLLLGTFVLFRISKQIADPLEKMLEKIQHLSVTLGAAVGVSDPMSLKKIDNNVGYEELLGLAAAVDLFEHIFIKTEEMRAELNEERSRNFSSSKLVALGEMAGGIAHEINSPLAVIGVLADQMQELVQEENIDKVMFLESCRQIESTTIRISKIVTGLRSFSRNAVNDPFIPVAVKSIVEDTVAFCSEKFRNHGVELIIEKISSDLIIDCRPGEISQILLNMLNNAYDAVEKYESKWVKISVLDRDSAVELSVTDCGAGIAPEICAKLFQPFFTTKEVGKGTGLGLGISRKIAENHRGTLSIDASSLNTRFVVYLPKKQLRNAA